jgi:hypothetical protein
MPSAILLRDIQLVLSTPLHLGGVVGGGGGAEVDAGDAGGVVELRGEVDELAWSVEEPAEIDEVVREVDGFPEVNELPEEIPVEATELVELELIGFVWLELAVFLPFVEEVGLRRKSVKYLPINLCPMCLLRALKVCSVWIQRDLSRSTQWLRQNW